MGQTLIGREDAARAVDALLDALPQRGGALLLRGARGLGRSALLKVAQARAEVLGFAVLTGAGTAAESAVPFAGLHRLLRPLRTIIEDLPDESRRALAPALPSAVARFRASLAVLEALAQAAQTRPFVILVDDLQWLDPPTQELLAFAARRLDAIPIAVIATSTTAGDGAFAELALAPLDDDEARALLARHALPARLEAAIITQAEGLPLALTELAREAQPRADALAAEPVITLPVGWRLADALQDRVASHPERVRDLLLAAALDPAATVDEVLAVAGASAADLGVALSASALALDGGTLRFPAPLTRLAVRNAAASAQLEAVHAAFAVHVTDPHRRALHRAVVATAADVEHTAELGRAARAARRRGDPAGAVVAYEAAARLTEPGPERVRWLLNASSAGFELGEPAIVRRVLDEAERIGPPAALAPLLEWQRRLLIGEWPPPDDADSARLVGALVSGPDADAALTALMPLAMGCWWADPSARVRGLMRDSATRLERRTSDPRAIAIAALADPVETAAAVRRRLVAPAPEDLADPLDAMHLGIAAQAIGAWRESYRLLGPAVERLRRRGHAGALAQALIHLAHTALYTGDWALAAALGEEACAVAQRASRPRQAFAGALTHARALALTGADDSALAKVEVVAAQVCLPGADAVVRSARACAALAAGDPERAVERLEPLFATPSGVPQAMVRAGWEIFDLVEALTAVHRHADARDRLRDYEAHALRHPGGLAEAAITCARALLEPAAEAAAARARRTTPSEPSERTAEAAAARARRTTPSDPSERTAEAAAARARRTTPSDPSEHATAAPPTRAGRRDDTFLRAAATARPGAFERALAHDLSAWPFLRARTLLAHGEQLRRAKRLTEAADTLRAARDELSMLGAAPFVERAQRELRAAGASASAPRLGELTPHGPRIARLAADGLSNPEIGAQLAVSPRTISSHLYRVFPKLGVTSRSQLKAALVEP